MSNKNDINLESTVEIKESIIAIQRTYFSLQHIQSAVYFAKEVGKIETKEEVNAKSDTHAIHNAYVTASIFATIAFFEANINEIFCDSYDTMIGKSANDGKYIPDQLINKLGMMWQLEIPRTAYYSVLQKHQIALALAEKPLFDKGSNPYQNVYLFIKLRNALMHYEPESVISQLTDNNTSITEQKFWKMLRSKFELNPLTGKGNPFFPDKCLSYGCCKWGIDSNIAFTDEFFKRTGIRNKYEHIRSKLLLD